MLQSKRTIMRSFAFWEIPVPVRVLLWHQVLLGSRVVPGSGTILRVRTGSAFLHVRVSDNLRC